MTFLIVHYTVHIPRWGMFTTGGVITDRRKLLSVVSQKKYCQSCIKLVPYIIYTILLVYNHQTSRCY